MKRKIIWIVVITIILGIIFGVSLLSKNNISADKKKVYAVLPLTGSTANVGQNAKKAIDVYLKLHKESKIDVVFLDAESSASKALSSIAQATVRDQNPIVLTVFSFLSNSIIAPIEEKNGFTFGMVTINVNSSHVKNSKAYQRICWGIPDVVLPLCDYIKAREVSNLAIIYLDDEYGVGHKDGLKEAFQSRGGHVVKEEPFSLSSTDVRDSINKIVASKPDAIFVSGIASTAYINVLKTLLSVRYGGEIVTDTAFSNPYVPESLGKDAEKITFVCAASDIIDCNDATDFVHMCQMNDLKPYYVTAQVFDAMSIIDFIIGSQLDFSQNTLNRMKDFSGVTHELKILPHGECSYPCKVVRIVDGRVEEVRY